MSAEPERATASVAEHFRAVAARGPDAIALVSGAARFTYADLDRWSDAVAASLLALEVPVDRPVAISVRDNVLLAPATLGVVKAGRFFVCVDGADQSNRTRAILDASGAAVVLGESGAASAHLRRIAIPAMPASPGPAPRERPHDLVQIVFTSGTTGRPKGVATRQGVFSERMQSAAADSGRIAGQRLSFLSLPGFARTTAELLGSLMNGATLCALDPRSASMTDLARWIVRERITVLSLPPALFRRLTSAVPDPDVFAGIRKLRLGADPITLHDVETFRALFPRSCTLDRAFNATETGTVLQLRLTHDTPLDDALVPVGRLRPEVEVWLQDESGNEVPDGTTGELLVRSAQVAHGYWNDAALTAQKFEPPRDSPHWTFRTGDLVRRDAEGLYYFVGRRDFRLKIAGRRIDPLEIETEIARRCDVTDVAVVGRTVDGETRLAAYAVPRPGGTITPRSIRETLRATLPAWLVPSEIELLDALPVTPSGKVDRAALSSRAAAEVPGDTAIVDRGDDLTTSLLAIWSRVLRRAVGPGDDFFDDLGGDSLLAGELVTEVRAQLGVSVPLSMLLELNTVAKMGAYLRAHAHAPSTVIEVQAGRHLPPLFCVTGAGGSAIIYRTLARLLGEDQPVYALTHHGFAANAFPRTLAAIASCYVTAIRSVQPHGPYYVAGYSGGGLVAHELSRQLHASGEEVAFTGLIDTSATGKRSPALKRAAKFPVLIRRQPLKRTIRYGRAVARRVARIGLWLMGRGWRFPSAEPRHVIELNQRYRQSVNRSLQPFAGDVTLFRAQYGWGIDGVEPDLGWGAICRSVHVLELDADHDTIIGNDVAQLAALFRPALERARAAAATREEDHATHRFRS